MNALWETYSTYPSAKMPSKDQKDERFKYLERRRKMMQSLLPKSLYDSVSEQELSKLGELYEKAVLHPTKDILTPYTERVLLELHALRDPGVTLADVRKRSYSVRFDKSVKSSEADNMINPRYWEWAKDERTFYTRVLPTGYKEIGEEMSPEDRKVAEKFRKKLRSWYSLDAIDDKQYAIEADHFWQVCEKLDNL